MKKKILAVASGGGHWRQLMLLKPSFCGCRQFFVTTINGLPEENGIQDFRIVADSNKDQKLMIIVTFMQLLFIVMKYRPNIIITTGAAPGLLAIIIGRVFFIKSIWIDSIANAEELSLGGRASQYFANIVLTQWEHLADGSKVEYKGSIF